MPRQILTSANNPLHIAALPAGTGGGLIGVTFAPGKKQPNSVSGHHDRDLGADLDQIAAWNAAIVVTLMEPQELAAVAIPHLGAEVRRRHMEWHHWPIIDVSTPDPAFDAAWPERSAKLRTVLANGGRVLGGVDPTTLMTYGFDPATGRPEPGRTMTEPEIYGGIVQALGIPTPGAGLTDMRAMRRA